MRKWKVVYEIGNVKTVQVVEDKDLYKAVAKAPLEAKFHPITEIKRA